MKWPLITRARYEKDMVELKTRILDLERHFVTQYDKEGKIAETLADVPFEKRSELKKRAPARRPTWNQRRAWLEATEGGRNA